jgi:hypothetical protein
VARHFERQIQIAARMRLRLTRDFKLIRESNHQDRRSAHAAVICDSRAMRVMIQKTGRFEWITLEPPSY